MTKRKLKSAGRRFLAVLSSAALLASYGTVGLVTTAQAAEVNVQKSGEGETRPGEAKQMIIYDEYGNVLTSSATEDTEESAVIYVDNRSVVRTGDNPVSFTTAKITVEIINNDETLTDNINRPAVADVQNTHFGFYPSNAVRTDHSVTWDITLAGCNFTEKKDVPDRFTGVKSDVYSEESYAPGRYDLLFASSSGSVNRKINLVIQEPATDINIKDPDGSYVSVNDDNFFNSTLTWSSTTGQYDGGYTLISHRDYVFKPEIVTEHQNMWQDNECFDHVGWKLVEGKLNPRDDTVTFESVMAMPDADETKAVIGENIVNAENKFAGDITFTGNDYGEYTLVAFFKPTVKTNTINQRKQAKYDREVAEAEAAGEPTDTIPLPVFINDRIPVQGEKSYSFYTPEVEIDKDTKEPKFFYDEHGKMVYKTSNGYPQVTTYKSDEVELRDSYETFYDNHSGKLIVDGDLQLVDNKPQYKPVLNVPKYINITVLKENPASKVEFSNKPNNDELFVGQKWTLNFKATPHYVNDPTYSSDATDNFRWVSSDTSIATVKKTGDKQCEITPVSPGKVKISLLGDTPNLQWDYELNVHVSATSVSFEPKTLSTTVGQSKTLTAVMQPVLADDTLEWSTNRSDIVSITPDDIDPSAPINERTATITGVAPGTAEVTVKSKLTKTVIATCLVTVGSRIPAEKIVLDTNLNGELTYLSDPTKENSTDTIDLFETKSITINGLVTSNDGVTASDDVKWKIEGNDKRYVVDTYSGNSLTLLGSSRGTVKITAYASSDASIQKTFTVNVKKGCDSVTIKNEDKTANVTSVNMNEGDGGEGREEFALYLTADLRLSGARPYDHQDYVTTWKTSDESVVEVENVEDANGQIIGCKVKAIKTGSQAVVQAVTASGKTASMIVNVFTTKSVEINGADGLMDDNKTQKAKIDMTDKLIGQKKLSATVLDSYGNTVNNANCVWTSSDQSVAVVSSTGVVTAVGVGTTTIKVACGHYDDTCVVHVRAPITAGVFDTIESCTFDPTVFTYEPPVSFTIGNRTLTQGVDCNIEYKNNTKVGKASVTITGLGNTNEACDYFGSKTLNFDINKRSIKDDAIQIDYVEDQECTGSQIIPNVNITYNNEVTLRAGTDYNISVQNNVKPGTATFTVTGIGNYTDNVTKTFNIYCTHKDLTNVTVIKRATYDEDGLEKGTCAACGEKDIQRIVPRFVHTGNTAVAIYFARDCYGVDQGKEMTLEPIIAATDPSQPATDHLRWESSDPQIITVDENGKIKGLKKGKATITVYGEVDGVQATCEVAVLNKLTDLTVEPESIETREGITAEIKAVVKPEKLEDEILWISADNSVATVTPSETNPLVAEVKGVKKGETTITVRGKYSNVAQVINVTVSDRIPSEIIAVSTMISGTPVIIDNSTPTYVYTHKTFTNDDIVLDGTLANKAGTKADDVVVWRITDNEDNNVTIPDYDPTKEYVGDHLTIHAASLGTVTVTAYAQSNPSLETHFKLEVAKRCDNITLYDENNTKTTTKSLDVNEKLTLTPDLTINDPNHPYDHGDGIRSWTSSNTEVATVNDGVVTPKQDGTSIITAETLSGRKAIVNLTVFTTSNVYIVRGVTPPENPGDLPTGSIHLNDKLQGNVSLGSSVYDENEKIVNNSNCTWTSSNEKVATVDAFGKVTGLSAGTTVITVKSGTKTEQALVTVKVSIKAITYDPIEDYTYTPKVTIYEPDPVFKVGEDTLVKDVDYTVEYSNNTSAGKATLKVTGIGLYDEVISINYNINKRSLNDELVTVDPVTDQEFSGAAVTPEPRVFCDGIELVKGVDFTYEYVDNKQPGNATLKIKAVGNSNYTDIREIPFTIEQPGMMGDVDGDLTITSNDAFTVLRAAVGQATLNDNEKMLADVNKDGMVDSADSLAILRYSVGLGDPSGIIGSEI